MINIARTYSKIKKICNLAKYLLVASILQIRSISNQILRHFKTDLMQFAQRSQMWQVCQGNLKHHQTLKLTMLITRRLTEQWQVSLQQTTQIRLI